MFFATNIPSPSKKHLLETLTEINRFFLILLVVYILLRSNMYLRYYSLFIEEPTAPHPVPLNNTKAQSNTES